MVNHYVMMTSLGFWCRKIINTQTHKTLPCGSSKIFHNILSQIVPASRSAWNILGIPRYNRADLWPLTHNQLTIFPDWVHFVTSQLKYRNSKIWKEFGYFCSKFRRSSKFAREKMFFENFFGGKSSLSLFYMSLCHLESVTRGVTFDVIKS